MRTILSEGTRHYNETNIFIKARRPYYFTALKGTLCRSA